MGYLFAERRSEREDTAYSPRFPRGGAFGCKQFLSFLKKFVIGCHWVHTFTRLNLLLEPKRLLQRFGFVFLGDVAFYGFSPKEQEKQKGEGSAMSALVGFSHKGQEKQE